MAQISGSCQPATEPARPFPRTYQQASIMTAHGFFPGPSM